MNTVRVSLVAILCVGLALARSPVPDLFAEGDDSSNDLQSNSVDPFAFLSGGLDVIPDLPCQMDIQVTKRVAGHCVKLGHSHGCMAGSYLNPFHHECLLR